MKSKTKLGFGLLLTLMIVIALGYKGIDKETEQYQEIDKLAINDNFKITGEELYQNNCAACHGAERQGNPPTFPSLVNINQKLSKEQIGTLLKTGRNLMPDFSHLSESERKAIVGFLYGESIQTDVVTEVTSIENGKNLFVANCAQCHQPDDSQRTRQWGMKPPVLNGVSDWVNISQFKRILNMGPCYMPSFAAMDDKNKEDIYAYLSTLEGSHQNTDYRTRRGCSYGMGMR